MPLQQVRSIDSDPVEIMIGACGRRRGWGLGTAANIYGIIITGYTGLDMGFTGPTN
jgi:hypothetical protein